MYKGTKIVNLNFKHYRNSDSKRNFDENMYKKTQSTLNSLRNQSEDQARVMFISNTILIKNGKS